jgi:uncharacterized membrane protein
MTTLRRALRVMFKGLFAAIFILGGINHFLNPAFYTHMMPPWLPWHLVLVDLSGVAEVLLGITLLIPASSRLAAMGLVALLVAVFPANLHMALHAELYPEFNPVGLWIRLPLQGVLIAWAWMYAMPPRDASRRG